MRSVHVLVVMLKSTVLSRTHSHKDHSHTNLIQTPNGNLIWTLQWPSTQTVR